MRHLKTYVQFLKGFSTQTHLHDAGLMARVLKTRMGARAKYTTYNQDFFTFFSMMCKVLVASSFEDPQGETWSLNRCNIMCKALVAAPMVEAYEETEEENFLLWRLEKGVAEGSIEIPKEVKQQVSSGSEVNDKTSGKKVGRVTIDLDYVGWAFCACTKLSKK